MSAFVGLEEERRIKAIEGAGGAEKIGYTPADANDWSPAPTTIKGALDQAAGRLADVEDALPADATGLDYTPTTAGDWSPAPGTAGGALDQAAARLKAVEGGALPTLTLAFDVGVEDGPNNTITTTITATDAAGVSVVGATFLLELLDDGLQHVDSASASIDATTGTPLNNNVVQSNASQLLQGAALPGDANGAVVVVKDKVGTLEGRLWIRATPVGRVGPVYLQSLTFA